MAKKPAIAAGHEGASGPAATLGIDQQRQDEQRWISPLGASSDGWRDADNANRDRGIRLTGTPTLEILTPATMMATKPKHGNDYYLKKIRGKRPDLYADIEAGKISVAGARKLAGLGGVRTRLHELKNAWTKATPQEQSDFLSWAGLGAPATPPATLTGSAFDSEGIMLDWARRRIPEIMARRSMSFGEVADELGIKRMDQSVSGAVRNGTQVKVAATASAVDAWLTKNVSV